MIALGRYALGVGSSNVQDGSMQYILINAGPILGATLAGFIVTVIYGDLAGRRTAADARVSASLSLLAFVAEGWLACILAGALILAPHQAGVWVMSLGSAVIIWIGFVLPSLLVTLRFQGVRFLPAVRDCGLWLVVMLVQAVTLQLIGNRPVMAALSAGTRPRGAGR